MQKRTSKNALNGANLVSSTLHFFLAIVNSTLNKMRLAWELLLNGLCMFITFLVNAFHSCRKFNGNPSQIVTIRAMSAHSFRTIMGHIGYQFINQFHLSEIITKFLLTALSPIYKV